MLPCLQDGVIIKMGKTYVESGNLTKVLILCIHATYL